ncbi:TPA: hypothetical protein QHP21_000677 [Klebsiella pneumoniae subsp. pneumoniae]|uniref:hypothetical protein n=1 Tax=Klebsiella pneumoniae complex TaxID=3390273 RepID=UPI001AD85CB3|nr:hypothetical protein [Klebsiella pneumoniae]HBZ7729281.1 hypothetical protein [Klebsiella variicola subsp. variicola]HDS2522708.1 hypothetical protein [Klebsiella pneumoniae subsp. pneumoniae]MBO8074341.1 hypothetical protein [Klebsiella pneumoniae]MCW0270153.1 hypothetical protein [Klebsiella pneumoniae]HCI5913129.1 hypothetical protein [Klebsiella pneumoniae]
MTQITQQTTTKKKSLTFPADFPSGTPPKEAQDASGVFFRLTKANPPGDQCFLNMKDENPKRLKKFTGHKLKCCYGVSVYTDENSIVNAFNKFPDGIGERFIAQGEFAANDGVMLKTGAPDSTHYTIWLYNESQVHAKFVCVRRLDK